MKLLEENTVPVPLPHRKFHPDWPAIEPMPPV